MLDEMVVTESPYRSKGFVGADNGSEHFISITAPPGLNFEQQLDYVETQYAEARCA